MPVDVDALLQLLSSLQGALVPGTTNVAEATPAKLNRLRAEVNATLETLGRFGEDIGQFKLPRLVFDPADPHVVGKLIGETLLQQERVPLNRVERFLGSGVYAIYYLGPFDVYSPVAQTDTPVYVGKADPADRYAKTPVQQGDRLSGRLGDHLKSITNADNLEVDDFDCRFLVVKTAWESTAEDYLISHFRPVWNSETKVCFGFGKHGDSAQTRKNTRSPWDTLHPGRPWAMRDGNVPNPRGVEGVKKDIADHFARHPPLHPEKKYTRRIATQ